MAIASLAESAQLTGTVLAPLVARGLLARRPRVVALEARFDAARRAVRVLQRLRARHGDEALLVPIPGRTLALPLAGEDAGRVLTESPGPFALATREKRAGLAPLPPPRAPPSRGPGGG